LRARPRGARIATIAYAFPPGDVIGGSEEKGECRWRSCVAVAEPDSPRDEVRARRGRMASARTRARAPYRATSWAPSREGRGADVGLVATMVGRHASTEADSVLPRRRVRAGFLFLVLGKMARWQFKGRVICAGLGLSAKLPLLFWGGDATAPDVPGVSPGS